MFIVLIQNQYYSNVLKTRASEAKLQNNQQLTFIPNSFREQRYSQNSGWLIFISFFLSSPYPYHFILSKCKIKPPEAYGNGHLWKQSCCPHYCCLLPFSFLMVLMKMGFDWLFVGRREFLWLVFLLHLQGSISINECKVLFHSGFSWTVNIGGLVLRFFTYFI